jgi:maltooligosyltrehalose trehalohydrolase
MRDRWRAWRDAFGYNNPAGEDSVINFGANLLSSGETLFRLWAPDCARVQVEIKDHVADGSECFPMTRQDDGFFAATLPVGAGTRYRYRVKPGLAVPDPASRAQDGDVHGYSIVVDPVFPWQHPGWRGRPWHEAVIYELHAGAYGGFDGIRAQLPYFKELGVTAIELMPIADFPGKQNWGYDGVLPYAPDEAYGTPEQLKSLIDAAHGLGLMVFLDVVYNHFGPDGNYLNAYASSFFTADVHTPWGNAIDFKRPEVRRFFIENALYWLKDYRFDGLRFDAVHAIFDETFLTDMAGEIRRKIDDRHVHLVLENEKNEAALLTSSPAEQKFDAQWTDDWHHCVHVLLTGESEGYYEDFLQPAEQLARALSEGFVYQGEPSPHAGGKPRGTKSAHLPTTAFVICLQNHDQIGNRAFGERLSVLAEPQALRAAALLLLLTPQIPMLFMGEEWGEQNPFLFFTDHHDELADAVRKGRRKEFAHFAAFSDPQKREQIPDPNAAETYRQSIPQWRDAESVEIGTLYKHGLHLRSQHIVPRLPGTVSSGARRLSDSAVTASWRMGDGALLTIACNLGREPVEFAVVAAPLAASNPAQGYDGATLPGFTTYVWLEQK